MTHSPTFLVASASGEADPEEMMSSASCWGAGHKTGDAHLAGKGVSPRTAPRGSVISAKTREMSSAWENVREERTAGAKVRRSQSTKGQSQEITQERSRGEITEGLWVTLGILS